MSEHDDHGHGSGREDDRGNIERNTSPMQPYTTHHVGIGLVVFVVGVVVTFGLPLVLA